MTRAVPIAALLAAALVPAAAIADAYEASVHVQPSAGAASIADPLAPDQGQTVAAGGAAARFTWATRDWLAWEVEGYALVAGELDHTDVEVDGAARHFSRRGLAAGVDAGATVRLGVTWIPTATLALGPQLRSYPSTTLFDSRTGAAVGLSGTQRDLDLAARLSAGLDIRIDRRWIAGVRGSARQALGLGEGSWRSFEATLHIAYYWYPRWWVLPRSSS